ncbi:ABC transporter permease [Nocardioides sp. zg-1228]|uniref:ABC transporter permease n=1 Tax=Nocardioides sp. zg-1228 TaxID=2763008 RepID=UPI0016435ED8|nr:FtsX-like permease family protein [Nocardioides sp. zg-1228]MBC2932420.1 FtsX-like permease family protein [Nocardioides sp. zg-1228]QSF57932.1 FtsX-like permease family protein [Nocardioides sp. zg-1228]
MRTVILASMRHHTRRYVAASLAVVIGVAFIVVIGMLTGATRSGLTEDTGAPVAGVDRVVSTYDTDEVNGLVDAAAEGGFAVLTLGYAMEPVARDGVQLAASADIAEASLDPRVQWQQLEDGRFPAEAGEALADVNRSKAAGMAIGDVVRIGSGSAATDVEIVGLVDSPAALGAALYVPWQDLRRFEDTLWIDAVGWDGPADLAREVAPDATVASSSDWTAARQAEITRGVDVIAIMALLFVAIALFVGVLVITNTFAILFAQRMRDFALLRCVGVTRRQLRGAIRLEALVLGVAASAIGVAVGTLAGAGLVVLVRRWFTDMGPAALDPVWTATAFAVGTLVTLGAAWLPTRAAVRVAPLAALRPATGVDVRSAAGRWRLALAALGIGAGGVLLAAAIATKSVPVMLAGGVLAFVGVLLLGPVLVPRLIRLTGALPGGGPVRRLATGNAVRNPRRTATTAASLLVGVTLTTAILTGLASSRTAIDQDMDDSHPLDSSITAVDEPLDGSLVDRVAATDGVAEAVALDGTTATIGQVALTLLAADDGTRVVRGSADLVPDDGVLLLPHSVVAELPARLSERAGQGEATVTVGGREHTLEVRTDSGWGRSGLVSATTLAALDPDARAMAVWARAADGADADELSGDLAVLAGAADADLGGGWTERSWVYLQVDILTGAVVGLMAVAILIALVGIANTLGLSVLERGRENALLRAMGLTREQLRRAMAAEGLLLSSVATLMGLAIGLAFAWVGVQVMVAGVVDGAGFTVPVWQLGAVALVAALAGLAACVVPARRAARVTPAAGLALV